MNTEDAIITIYEALANIKPQDEGVGKAFRCLGYIEGTLGIPTLSIVSILHEDGSITVERAGE